MSRFNRVACLLTDHFPALFERSLDRALTHRPIIITSPLSKEVFDSSPEAAQRGVYPGMPLQQAISICQEAALLEADIPKYQAAKGELLQDLERISPIVEGDGFECAYLDLKGLDYLYDSYEALTDEIIGAAPEYLTPALGTAGGKFPAYVAAKLARPGQTVTAPDDLKAYLKEVSIDLLPVDRNIKARLRDFGLDTLGAVANLPVGALMVQFGVHGRLIWQLSNGMDSRRPVARLHEDVLEEHLSFPTPTVTLSTILYAVEVLLGLAFSRPQLHSRYSRTATLKAGIFRGPAWQRRITFKEPAGSKERALLPIRYLLERIQLPGPLEDLTVTLTGLTGEAGLQTSLFYDVRKREQLRETVRQLEASMGKHPPIYQIREVEQWSRIPERRLALIELSP
ncbi:MAG: hypothetical protein EXR50_03495 [Dehalococcoidia bacterium]|nr:hypothetical protein [Dehalococcoidia bacterium]